MTTDDDINKASGDQIDARHSQGFIGQASGPVFQNFGEQRNINTGGGDFAGDNIDKRQGGPFVEGNVYGNVIGQQNIIYQPPLTPALHQLPAPILNFVGREREIDQLVQALRKAATVGEIAIISGVHGLGGIGKTELAIKVAHQLNDAFPDAQLLVELRGSSSPRTPEQALQMVIHAFEPKAEPSDDLGQLKGLYNSVLADKRVLILADDAESEKQVRPLRPPPGCALLVTSRQRLSLIGTLSGVVVHLGVLPPAEAETLLLVLCPRIGSYAKELAKLCGYLPLALRISAGLLETNDARDVARYLEQLRERRLECLKDPENPDDPQASVEASLRLSYDTLEPATKRALCQLSVFSVSFWREAAQTVVVVDSDIEAVLGLLRRRNLLEWDAEKRRYDLHDLVRAFAAARLEDADAVRLRHARYYARVAKQSGDHYNQGGTELMLGLTLFDQERAHIDAGWNWAMAHAGDWDADGLLLAYPNALFAMADLRYDARREDIPQVEAQLAAARRMGRRDNEAYALGNLGSAYAYLGDVWKAIEFHDQSLITARELGDRRQESVALDNLGNAYTSLGEAHKAIVYHKQSLTIARELGNRSGEGDALGNLGNAYYVLGDMRKAIEAYEQSLVIHHELGNRSREGIALGNLGNAYSPLGETRKAIDCYEQSLTIARELGDRSGEGDALGNLGVAYANLGELGRAIEFYEQSLVIHRGLGYRQGEATGCLNLGLLLERQGNLSQAVELMQVSVDYLREIGHSDADKQAAHIEQCRQRLATSQSQQLPDEG